MSVSITKAPTFRVIHCAASHTETLLNEFEGDYALHQLIPYVFDGSEKVVLVLVHKRTLGMRVQAPNGFRP